MDDCNGTSIFANVGAQKMECNRAWSIPERTRKKQRCCQPWIIIQTLDRDVLTVVLASAVNLEHESVLATDYWHTTHTCSVVVATMTNWGQLQEEDWYVNDLANAWRVQRTRMYLSLLSMSLWPGIWSAQSRWLPSGQNDWGKLEDGWCFQRG